MLRFLSYVLVAALGAAVAVSASVVYVIREGGKAS
jgi:hypothetical protein